MYRMLTIQYYKLLRENQEKIGDTYVNPYSKKQASIDQHVEKSIQELEGKEIQKLEEKRIK